ncbi:ammonium transporter [Chamaesiphon sp. OTE_20_metabat_361]|uniref:ammonium transporter n=1 Tax=Chamaesiphon sp. OTE_20_metabat_361 TaxID=2964689 RepID=UPI00286B4FE4|nr:ammonium transporter [Chamaesiphon sp. OTE_20_metabat_361]
MKVSKGRFSGRSSRRCGSASNFGLVSSKILKRSIANCAGLLTKVRSVATNSQQNVNSGLEPLPTHTRSGRRLDNWRRLGQRLQDPEWRRYGYLLLFSKFVAIVVLALVAIPIVAHIVGSPVLAADPVIKANDIVNPINTLWTLLAAFLVFGMQAGFTMLEAGFSRSRETVNVLMECIVDTCLCGILFYAIGFAFMFSTGNGFIGGNWFFLQGAPATYGSTGVAFLAYWLFQFAFADTCSTITSGAMLGRTGFVGDLLYSTGVSGFIYPIIGHWVWGPDGFLVSMGSENNFLPFVGTGFRDFAGSAVIHTVGGIIALAGAIVLGPRLGRVFKRDGGGPMLPHDLTIAAIGGLILWFGWYGFNPGSTLSAMDFQGTARVAANTTLAACAGGLSAMFVGFPKTKKWDLSYTVNGFLAGLVSITCPCYWVNPTGSILIGAIGGAIVVWGIDLLEWLRIDDPIGAVPVHGFCGIWGTLALGFFATGEFGATGPFAPDNSAPVQGLLYGGGMQVLTAQFIGSAIVTLSAFSLGMALMAAVNLTGTLRVSQEGELEGIDVHEHGIPAYPEYVIQPTAAAQSSYESEGTKRKFGTE